MCVCSNVVQKPICSTKPSIVFHKVKVFAPFYSQPLFHWLIRLLLLSSLHGRHQTLFWTSYTLTNKSASLELILLINQIVREKMKESNLDKPFMGIEQELHTLQTALQYYNGNRLLEILIFFDKYSHSHTVNYWQTWTKLESKLLPRRVLPMN